MAIIKSVPIRTRDHLHHALNYAGNALKTQGGELVTYVGCQQETAYQDFERVRRQSGKTYGLLGHHFFQSFKPGEVDPETAHQIGVQLGEQMFPGFQYEISTHVDKGHIHNHIVLNSVSAATGKKYNSNKSSWRLLCDANDRLCREYGLSVISSRSGYKSIDKTTYELAAKGKSWKVMLCNDLDDILKSEQPPRNMRQFAKALQKRDYDVRVSERNITVTKRGEKKGVRLDTLARQFGVEYTKTNVERILQGKPPDMTLFPADDTPPDPSVSEWSRAEQLLFSEIPKSATATSPMPNTQALTMPEVSRAAKDPALSAALRHRRGMQSAKTLSTVIIHAAQLGMDLLDPETRRKYNNVLDRERRQCGNCTARQLKGIYGENVYVTLTAEQAEKLRDLPMLYTGMRMDDGYVRVSYKIQHRPLVAGYLGIPEAAMKVQSERQAERNSREYLKQLSAARPSERRISCSCTVEELKTMERTNIPHDYLFCRNNTVRLGILSGDLPTVCKILNWDDAKKETLESAINRGVYRILKQQCDSEGIKPAYRVMTPARLEQLRQAGVSCAAFPAKNRPGMINVAMYPKDVPIYEDMLYREQMQRQAHEEIAQRQDIDNAAGKKPKRTL